MARRAGDDLVLEPIGGDVMFEGGEPNEGVLATFTFDGREVTGRIIEVSHSTSNIADSELVVTVEQIDREVEDVGAEEALRSLPPGSVEEKKV